MAGSGRNVRGWCDGFGWIVFGTEVGPTNAGREAEVPLAALIRSICRICDRLMSGARLSRLVGLRESGESANLPSSLTA